MIYAFRLNYVHLLVNSITCTEQIILPLKSSVFDRYIVTAFRRKVQILIVESAFDLGSGLRWIKATVPFLRPANDALHLKSY
jgi:hypothetical protein